MAENESGSGSPADRGNPASSAWLLRLLWPLPGALTGAAVGFHLYFRQPGLNTDTAAPAILASLWALGGLFCGMLASITAGWLIDRGLRGLLRQRVLICGALTLLGLIALCSAIYPLLEARLPALLWPARVHQNR